MKTVAFFSDRTILPGLHVTLYSLVSRIPDEEIDNYNFVIFANLLSLDDIKLLKETVTAANERSNLHISSFSPKKLEGGNSLHGNYLTYGRLFLAELLPSAERCLYLDCDLIVNIDIGEIFDLIDDKHTIVADGTGKRDYSLDTPFFIETGLPISEPCFNAGVLGINLEMWRDRNITTKCYDTALKMSGKFMNADQSLLNVVLHDDFKSFGNKYNWMIYPLSDSLDPDHEGIIHFVGSPKPWDFLGSVLHRNYALWKRIYDQTALRKQHLWKYLSVKRSLAISKRILVVSSKKLFRKG
jgi:lipopolysaccharide biosynthesis glycosyltransferase